VHVDVGALSVVEGWLEEAEGSGALFEFG